MTFRPAISVLALSVVCGGAVASLHGQQAAKKVDDATLLKPADGDWVSYGRDYAEAHHSPLTQINQSNVSRLGLAYAIATLACTGLLAIYLARVLHSRGISTISPVPGSYRLSSTVVSPGSLIRPWYCRSASPASRTMKATRASR